MNLIKELEQLPRYSIYGFFNEQDKKVYIGYAFDTAQTLVRKLRELRYSNMGQDWDKLEFKIIETLPSRKDICLIHRSWCLKYKQSYELYNRGNYKPYKLTVDIIKDDRRPTYQRPLFRVRLAINESVKRLVGVFDHKTELDKFINNYYSNGPILDIVYAKNQLTQEYLLNG